MDSQEIVTVLKSLINIYLVEVDEDGEPKSSVIDIMQTWAKAQEIINKLS